MKDEIIVRGARENNLKNITVSELIKLGKLVNRVNENFGKENLK